MIAKIMIARSDKIADLWSLGILGIKDPIASKLLSDREKEVKDAFLKTVTIINKERYEDKLCWIENHSVLKDHIALAIKRLQFTMEKLNAYKLYDEYDVVFKEWFTQGIIEQVPNS